MKWNVERMLTDLYDRTIPQYFDEDAGEFKPQKQVATEDGITRLSNRVSEELEKNESKVALEELGASEGEEIEAGGSRFSPLIPMENKKYVTFSITLSEPTPYHAELLESISTETTYTTKLKRVIPQGATETGLSGTVRVTSPAFRFYIYNDSDRPANFGLSLYVH